MGKQYVNQEGRIPMIRDWGDFIRQESWSLAFNILSSEQNYPNDKQLCR